MDTFTMKEVCDKIDITYETLKYYCNIGLVPNVTRDKNNHRHFTENDIMWLEGLKCLKKCGLSIKEMLEYMEYCVIGIESIPQRKKILDEKREILLNELHEIEKSIDYIDTKQQYYDDVLSGDIQLTSYFQKS